MKRRNVGIQIDGPDFLALGVPFVYSCRALYSDGSSEVVNPIWQVESEKVTMNTWGVATPYECGAATIGAKCNVDDRIVSVAKEIAVLNLSECLDCASLTFSVYGTGEWAPTAESPFKGKTALMGRVSKQGDSASVSVACPGAGEIGFCWKMNQVVPGDRMEVLVDGVVKSSLEAQADWAEVAVKVTGNSYHIVTWRYVAGGAAGQEHKGSSLLDNVTWRLTSTQVVVPAEITGGKEIVVDESWPTLLDARFGAGKSAAFVEEFGADLSSALVKTTGKKDTVGNDMYVWQDFVAGTDPVDLASRFTASIKFVNGKPVITYAPDLMDERKYIKWGKKNLADPAEDWSMISEGQEGNYNFFKVSVEMP